MEYVILLRVRIPLFFTAAILYYEIKGENQVEFLHLYLSKVFFSRNKVLLK